MIGKNDIEIVCACGTAFVWTERDQAFYREKGYQRPKRCRKCAQKKREQTVTGAGYREKGREDKGPGIWR